MSEIHNFRTAFKGFNKEDVVRYIEYINNRHNAEIQQLNTRLQNAQPGDPELQSRLEAAEEKIRELEEALAAAQSAPQPETAPTVNSTADELEAYRRAERAERLALERARQTRDRANGVLADATSQVQVAAAQLEDAARTIAAQLDVYKTTVLNAGSILTDAAATLGALAPEEE